MGCSYEMNGFTNYQELGNSLAKLLVSNGFSRIFPNPITSPTIADTDYKFTLKAGLTVDPLNDDSPTAQSWCIHIDCSDTVTTQDPGTLRIYLGTDRQFPADGTVSVEYPGQRPPEAIAGNTSPFGQFPRKSGELQGGYYSVTPYPVTGWLTNKNPTNVVSIPFASKYWGKTALLEADMVDNDIIIDIDTATSTQVIPDTNIVFSGADITAHPISYRLTISDHGISVIVWEEGQDLWGNRFSWFVCQRPVDSVTGNTLVVKDDNSRCPVFCVYSVGGGDPTGAHTASTTSSGGLNAIFNESYTASGDPWKYIPDATGFFIPTRIYRFTVRERDILKPTLPVLATMDTPDNKAVINGKEQGSITETNQYVISFMKGFNTARYMYNEELDMITYTSADVLSQYSDITIQPYVKSGTPITTKYKAMHANAPDNTGMRILILIDGQGVTGICA